MILTKTYAVKHPSLRMYNPPEGLYSYPHAATFSVAPLSAVWQLTAPARDLLHPPWTRTPLSA